MIKILIGVVIATIVVIGTFMFLDPNIGISTSGDVTETTNKITISIDGSVFKPGSYTMADNATMEDLIDAAGGLLSNADERAFYYEAEITKGMTYYIASKYDASDLCNNNELDKANINSDSAETLSSINGISLSTANSIVTYREENGLFSTIEQLQEVYGIGSATYKKIRNYVILHA